MRQFILCALAATTFLTTSCEKKNAENAAADLTAKTIPHYMIVPGPVTGSRAAGINATFKLVQATVGNGGKDSGITSDQLGGACILFRAADLGYTKMAAKSCTTQADCDTGEGAPYCDGGQCWSRPFADPDPLCRRSGDTNPPTPWPVGQDVKIAEPGPIPVTSYNLPPNTQARVLACLRGKGTSQLCGKPHTLFKWGSPSTIP